MILEAISLAALLSRRPVAEPAVTCHRGTVSYRFAGTPGTSFRYMGETYSVPRNGSIELIGHGGDRAYQIGDRRLSLESWPADEFGTCTVPLPDTPDSVDPLPLREERRRPGGVPPPQTGAGDGAQPAGEDAGAPFAQNVSPQSSPP